MFEDDVATFPKGEVANPRIIEHSKIFQSKDHDFQGYVSSFAFAWGLWYYIMVIYSLPRNERHAEDVIYYEVKATKNN